MPTRIAFLRAIGPESHKKMTMAALRDGLIEAGFGNVRTVLATGNVIFKSALKETTIVQRMGEVIGSFGLDNDVFVREPEALSKILDADPFDEAAAARPHHMVLMFFASPPDADRLQKLLQHDGPEKVRAGQRELYIDYSDGIGTSKFAPGVIERRLKQKGTARNWNTLMRILALAAS
jgi:uncharacterized protein (DUF1697 family)